MMLSDGIIPPPPSPPVNALGLTKPRIQVQSARTSFQIKPYIVESSRVRACAHEPPGGWK